MDDFDFDDEIYMDEESDMEPEEMLAEIEEQGCADETDPIEFEKFDMSFFDYLNSHRIKHARELLSRTDGESNAILNIAFTVGFNSNSAFYAAFKKHVGVTPAQFRRENMLKSP